MELLNGHIYIHLDLGSGGVKVRGSRRRVDDGEWHEFTLKRSNREGRVTVDSSPAEFITPGMFEVGLLYRKPCLINFKVWFFDFFYGLFYYIFISECGHFDVFLGNRSLGTLDYMASYKTRQNLSMFYIT